MTPLALALALALSGDPRTDLTLTCDGCFGLSVDLDGEHLVHLPGVGSARVQDRQLGVSKDARFTALPPGMHHLKIQLLQGPLDSELAYDGDVYLRPGAQMVMKVHPGSLEDVTPNGGEPPRVDAGSPDGGKSASTAAALTVRADDEGQCEVALDGAVRLSLRRERVVRLDEVKPGLHRLEVRTLQGQTLVAGSLFVGQGDDIVAGAHCQTGAFQVFSDPRAFHPDAPRR
ncbi:MAG: hypothetical protein JST54_24140 [Deltaproteobacteria bacterium]|nr:hypothetical protein [Deltaproteobacteria bacterium]